MSRDPLAWLTYEFCSKVMAFTLTFGWSLRVAGGRNVPRRGPALLIANHQSYLDPPSIGVGVPRHMGYLARKPLFSNKWFGYLLRVLHAVPVDQEGIAKDGIRGILRQLEAGWPVLVFPEGARCENGTMQKLQPGVSLLVKRVRCPIVPVGIAGAFASWNRFTRFPNPSPLFLPATKRCVAVSIGRPRPAATVADLSRNEMLEILWKDIAAQAAAAEKMRRQ